MPLKNKSGLHRWRAQDVVILSGLTPQCTAVAPWENVLAEAHDVLVRSGKIYRYGNSVVMEQGREAEAKLAPLATDTNVEASAGCRLANLFIFQHASRSDDPIQFPPPARFVTTLLIREPTIASLPRIKLYALRPVFDEDFQLRGPGWHGDVEILVHGLDIEPILPDDVDSDLPAIERLPPHLSQAVGGLLLQGGC